MDSLKGLLVLTVLFQVALCFRSRSHHCVAITSETAPLCANLSLGYDKMILPNFLRHDTVAEVRRELAQWSLLVRSGCHQFLKHFLCSVYAPVCMPELIPPCRSLCSMVRNSCEPLMRRYNYTWPLMLKCQKYPEDNMCVKIEAPTPTPVSSVCAIDGRSLQFDSLQEKFCNSDFAIRARVNEKKTKDDSLILKVNPTKNFKGSLKRGQVQRLRIPIVESSACENFNMRKQVLIFGTKRGRRMFVTSLMKWKDFRKMGRRLREKDCRKI